VIALGVGLLIALIASLAYVLVWEGCPSTDPVVITHQFDDSQDQDHTLVLEMQGKLPEHTQVSSTGEIVKDRYITVSDFAFDDIPLGHMLTEVARYQHDTNGTTDTVNEPFYGVMGCNGRVELRFSTPIYLWLLENM
jgi:hypothetical protein